MKRMITALGLATASLGLVACSDGRYHSRTALVWTSYDYGYWHPYWYDGYYGPIYDGYWGRDGYFYYRVDSRSRYRRGSYDHFRRDTARPGRAFSRYENEGRRGDERKQHRRRGNKHD